MGNELLFFNSVEAAKLLNVNVSSIKRWTDEGKLACIRTAGGHRKFLITHLAEFLKEYGGKNKKASLFPIENKEDVEISYSILNRQFERLVDYTLENALMSRQVNVNKVLTGLYLSNLPLHEIYDRVVTPVLWRTGEEWEAGNINIVEEHFITQTIRDVIIRLQGFIKIRSQINGKAFCLTMSSELHDIALKMVDHILELNGFQVYFSGQLTPSIKIEKIFNNYLPDRVYISSTIVNDLNGAQAEFDKICYISAEHNATVYVGGRGFDQLDFSHSAVNSRFYNIQEVQEELTSLSAGHTYNNSVNER